MHGSNIHPEIEQVLKGERRACVITADCLAVLAQMPSRSIAAIVYWNTIYMDAAAQHLRSTSVAVPDYLLAHTSPVGWEHIAFSGDFLWDRAAASTGRKALNLPPDSRVA